MKMDDNTLILIGMTFGAFCWWFSIQLNERMTAAKENKQKKVDRMAQVERIRQLTNKM